MRRAFDSIRTLLAIRRVGRRATIQVVGKLRQQAWLAHNLQLTLSMLSLCLPLYAASQADAQEHAALQPNAQGRVLLQEVMPELAGTALGAIDVAAAPVLGSSLLVRKIDVQRALLAAGASSQGLNIPRAFRVKRAVTSISQDELRSQAQRTLEQAVAPCALQEARLPNEVRVASGPRAFRAEFANGLRNGQITGALFVESGGYDVRVPVVARLACPAPEVNAGSQVTAVAVVGQVTASAPAEARQPGRVGEVIRITNRATGVSLRARVLDARTVQVVP